MDPELKLEKAKTVIRQREAVREQLERGQVRSSTVIRSNGTKESKRYEKADKHTTIYRSGVLDVERINIHVMPALQKMLLAENVRKKAILL